MGLRNELKNIGIPLSKEQIQESMKVMNILMPEEYVQFLLLFNGGSPVIDTFDRRHADGYTQKMCVDRFLSLDEVLKAWEYTNDILNEDSLFTIGDTLGSSMICLKSGQMDKAEVYIWDGDFGATFQANSLQEFMDSLYLGSPRTHFS